MTYTEAIAYVDSLTQTGKKNGLNNIKEILELMGNPQNKLKFIHVAGTNGKGSTVAMTASVLKNAGYKTGMYISPHIIDFRERIQINGQMISEEETVKLIVQIKKYADILAENGIFITYFEFITAMAFQYFYNEKCDFSLLETGIGGKFDATNIITGTEVSAITSISIDHTDMLGDTIQEITAHKCGIIKEGASMVCYPLQDEKALPIIKETALKHGCKFILPDISDVELLKSDFTGMDIKYRGKNIHIPFMGRHQICNFLTVTGIIKALGERGYNISDEQIKTGVEGAKFPVRTEILSLNPTVIVDGAHNKSGAQALAEVIDMLKGKNITVIMGMLRDKDYQSAVRIISSKADRFIGVTPNYYRGLPAHELVEYAVDFCKNCEEMPDVITAYENVIASCSPEDILVVCGSLYLASEFRSYIMKN